MTSSFRFATKFIAAGAALLFVLVITSCDSGRLQSLQDEKARLRHCKSILITGCESYQLFNCGRYPECFLALNKNSGKQLEIRDPFYIGQIYQPKVTFDNLSKKYSFSFEDHIDQPKVDNPDLTIEVLGYREDYGSGIYVGPGFSDNRFVAASVRITVTHKTLGVLFEGRFRAHPPVGLLDNLPKATGLDVLVRRIKASPVGDILLTALQDDN
jgi:hypothetical protein